MLDQTAPARPFDSAAGTTGRVIAARIHPDRDVLASIEEICLAHGVTCGQLATTIGSFRRRGRDPETGVVVTTIRPAAS